MNRIKNQDFQYLKTKCPNILSHIVCPSIGEGWLSIIQELFIRLEELALKEPEQKRNNYYVVQCKEKFGTLRVYMHASTEEMDDEIRLAEDFTCTTCENCGEKGSQTGKYWIKTLCEECDKEINK